jgi:hypothetical protein
VVVFFSASRGPSSRQLISASRFVLLCFLCIHRARDERAGARESTFARRVRRSSLRLIKPRRFESPVCIDSMMKTSTRDDDDDDDDDDDETKKKKNARDEPRFSRSQFFPSRAIASRYVNKCRASNQIRVNENGTMMMMFRDDGCVERRLDGDKTNITTRDRWIQSSTRIAKLTTTRTTCKEYSSRPSARLEKPLRLVVLVGGEVTTTTHRRPRGGSVFCRCTW